MNTKRFCASAAAISLVALALPVHAQLLGGNVNGALGGTLSGGLRNSDVVTRGDMTGSLGAGLETDTLRRASRTVRGTTDTAVSGVHKAARKGTATARSARKQTHDGAVGAKGSVEGAVSQAGGIAGSINSAVSGSVGSTASGAGGAAPSGIAGSMDSAVSGSLASSVSGASSAAAREQGQREEGNAPLIRDITHSGSASASGSLAQAGQLEAPEANQTAEPSGNRDVALQSSVSADASADATVSTSR
jgi:hypothetical protein